MRRFREGDAWLRNAGAQADMGVDAWCMVRLPRWHANRMSEDAEAPDGDLAATAAELVPILLDDLRSRARWERRRVGAGATLRTTALVNEAVLRLQRGGSWNDERHFLHAAALAMRQVLVDHARRRLAAKRGGGRVDSLDDHPGIEPFWVDDERLVQLDEAMQRLAALNPRLTQVVECRFFGGYSEQDAARILGVSDRTVRRDWIKARAWLYQALQAAPD